MNITTPIRRVLVDRNGNKHGSAPLLGLVALLLLDVVLPVLLITSTRGSFTSLQPWPAFLVMAVSGYFFSRVLWSASVRPHEMIFWLFTYVFMGMAPTVQMREHVRLDTTPNTTMSLAGPAFAMVLIGCLAFVVGTAVRDRRAASAPLLVPPLRLTLSKARVKLVLLGALGATVLYLMRLGGPSALVLSRFELSDRIEVAFGETFQAVMMAAISNMGLLVAFVALVLLARSHRRDGVRDPFTLVLAWISGIALLAVVNPISSPRYIFGTVALSVLAACGAMDTLRRFRMISVAAMSAFPILFPILDSFRVSTNSGIKKIDPVRAMTSGDFDSFQQVITAYEYVHTLGATNGRQLLGVILFAVPRSLWPGKPVDTGKLLADFKDYKFTNLSAPLWSELFVNGGWVALVVGMFAIGYLLRHLDIQCQRSLEAVGSLPLLSCILPFYMLILLRGSLLQAMSNLFIVLLAAWFVRKWSRPRITAGLRPRRIADPG